jgi:hypothetical protein
MKNLIGGPSEGSSKLVIIHGGQPSISSTLNARVILVAFSSYMYVEKVAKTTFVRKKRAKNVDEIDSRYWKTTQNGEGGV